MSKLLKQRIKALETQLLKMRRCSNCANSEPPWDWCDEETYEKCNPEGLEYNCWRLKEEETKDE